VVCLPVTFVHCAQMAEASDKISRAYNSLMTLSDSVKIQLIPVNPFLPIFCLSDHPVDLSIRDIQWQIAVKWLDIAQHWLKWTRK